MVLFASSIFFIRFGNKTCPSIKVSTSLLKVKRASSLFRFSSTKRLARGFWALLGSKSWILNSLFYSLRK